MMTTYDIILKRRTIRRFRQSSLDENALEKMVNAARLAPTGANLQPCEFIIVTEKGIMNRLFKALKWAGYIAPTGNPPEDKRPMAYIVVLVNTERRKTAGEIDAAAAIMNIIYTALEMGIGSCWLGAIDREQIRTILHIPETCKIDSVVALGYPDEEPIVEPLADSVKYWKDEKGVLHVPKFSLDQVMHKNQYVKQSG